MFFVQPYDTNQYEFSYIEEAVDCAWNKLSEEEKQSIIDAYDRFDPEDTEHYFFDDWLTDNWQKYLSDYINEVVEDENNFVMGVPSYAVGYLVYGEADGLNSDDVENIDQWVERMRKDGKRLEINPISGRDEYFSNNPPFGLPCNVLDCWVLYL